MNLTINRNMITRLKFDILDVVNKMLDRLPDHVWTSKTTTFFDPNIAGGQFVAEVERRLKQAGHSDKNIRRRVFGIAEDILDLNYAIKKNKLVGTYNVGNFFEGVQHFKCDVIVGNPPYGKSVAGAGKKLWMRYVEHALKLLNTNGYMIMLHPTGWRQYNNGMWKNVYQKYQVDYVMLDITTNWNVGVKVDFYILRNCPYTKPTRVQYKNGSVEDVDFRKVPGLLSNNRYTPILQKLVGEKFQFQNKQSHHHTRSHMSKTKKRGFSYPIQHTGAQNTWWSSKPHEWQSKKKIIVSYSGHLNPFYDQGKLGTSQHSHVLFVNNKTEADYVIKLLNSKLYQFAIGCQKTNGFNDIKTLNSLPYPKDLPIDFTDDMLYTYFGISQDEIKLINFT